MNKKLIYVALSVSLLGGMVYAMVYKNKKVDVDLENASGKYSYGVSADHPEAVRVGMEILEMGGNAVDAAIAVGYALGVVEPFGSGIGGGGLMVVHPNQQKKSPTVFDYKETAPIAGSISSKGIGVPGFVRGMELAHKEFGRISMHKLIQPSIKLCEEGFEARDLLTRRLADASYRLQSSQMPHLFPNGKPIQPKERLIQQELASTLKKIQEGGSDAFYEGMISQDVAKASRGLQVRDIAQYNAIETKPIKTKIGNYEMITVAPPGGGPMLMQFLLMAEALQKKDPMSSESIQTMGAIQGQVDELRKKYIGDPRFVNVPVGYITSKKFLAPYIQNVESGYFYMKERDFEEDSDDNTTHFVVVDKHGMMVSCTNTLSNFFGSGVFVDGFFLNNKLTAFSVLRNAPNSVQPGKRSISYTAPTIFSKNNQPVLGIGASGGSRITFMLSEVIIRHLFYNEPLQSAITQPRFFVKNKVVYVEEELPAKVCRDLQSRGYRIEIKPPGVFYGGVQAIRVDPEKNVLEGGYDFRRDGTFKGSE